MLGVLPADFMGHRAKLDRARFHLNELAAGVREFRHRQPFLTTCEKEEGSRDYVMRLAGVEPTPPNWPLLIGDALYNMRASLDHLVYAVAKGQKGDRIEFPIVTDSAAKPGKGWKTLQSVLSTDAMSAVRTLQPYHRATHDPDGYVFHPLWQLHELNRIDKHRHLLAVVHFPISAGFRLDDFEGVDPDSFRMTWGAIEEGAELARATLLPDFEGEPQLRAHPTVHVVFGDPSVSELLLGIPETLHTIHNHIRDVVFPSLEAEIAKP